MNLAAISRFDSLGRRLRQQAILQFTRQGQIPLQAFFLAFNFFVKPGILQSNGNLRCQRRHGSPVVVGEESPASVFQVENSNDFVFVNQRHGQFGAGFRVHQNVARVFGYIRNQYRLLVLRGITHDSKPERAVILQLDVFPKAQRKTMLQFLSASASSSRMLNIW